MIKSNIFFLMLVTLITVIFVFVSCDNSKGLNRDSNYDFDTDTNHVTEAGTDQDMDQDIAQAKTVEAKYRFYGEHVYRNNDHYIMAHTKLDKNSLTILGNGVNISYTDVYTQGGGLIEESLFSRKGDWTYLYSGSVKIGYILTIYSTSYFEYGIGKTICKNRLNQIGQDAITFITEDIQNAHNGIGHGYW